MASNLGRGRGYSGKNKDIVRTLGSSSDISFTTPGSVSQRITKSQQLDQFEDDVADNMPYSSVQTMNHKNLGGPIMDNTRNKPKMPPATALPGYNQESTRGKMPSNQMVQNSSIISKQPQKPYEEPEKITQYSKGNVYILNKPSDTKTNTKHSQEEKKLPEVGNVSDENSQSVLYIEEKYGYLISQVSLLSSRDDGILSNQKLQHIEGILTKTCSHPLALRGALDALASAALLTSRMTNHVSLMCCSMWFTHAQLLGLRLHHIFMEKLTDKIEGLEISLHGTDQYLVNAASLLEDIYTKSKMMGSEEITSIARLIVQVCIELLECNTQLALRTLNLQLMSHGPKLYKSVPSKVESLSISARKLLIARQPPPPSCRVWLSLLADQCLYCLEPLPKYLQDYYAVLLDESTSNQEHEGQKEIIPPKDEIVPHAKMKQDLHRSFEVKNNENLKNIQNASEVRSRKSDSSDRWSVHSNGERNTDFDFGRYGKDDVFDEKNITLDSPYDSSGVSDSNVSENNDYHTSSSVNSYNTERKPRPILGAGSRLMQVSNRESDFNEQPAVIQAIPDYIDEIPVFCPSIPPPNFIPKSNVKHITSATQDTGDYWNTPPPPIQKFKIPESTTAHQVTSSLSSRLDLNSWRQQNNGTFDNEQDEGQLSVQDNDYYEDNANTEILSDSHEAYQDYDSAPPQNNTSLLDKVKRVGESVRIEHTDSTSDQIQDIRWNYQKNKSVSQNNDNNRRNSYDSKKKNLVNKPRSDTDEPKQGEWRQRRSEPIERVASERKKPFEKKYDSRENVKKSISVEEAWEETEENFDNLQIASNTFNSDGSRLETQSQKKDPNVEQNRGNRRPRNDRKSSESRQNIQSNMERREKDDKDSNWRNREGKQNNRGNSKKSESKPRERSNKILQETGGFANENWEEEPKDKETKTEDKKGGSRRDQRGPTKGKRNTMDPPRSGSYWTHDDRCDRDYNE